MNKDLILREKLALQRTILANQSTFLASGISIKNLTTIKYGYIFEIAFILISIILLTIGIINYKKQKSRIIESEIHIGNFKDDYKTTKA